MDGLKTVFARNCEVKRIPKEDALRFLSAHHRLGACSCRYAYALYVRRTTGAGEMALPEGTLVAVATFSNARRMRDGSRSFEWIRYCSLGGVRVEGGMGKLLDAFVSEIRPDDVVSYCDITWPDGGDVYEKLGFRLEGIVHRPGFSCYKFRKLIFESSEKQR